MWTGRCHGPNLQRSGSRWDRRSCRRHWATVTCMHASVWLWPVETGTLCGWTAPIRRWRADISRQQKSEMSRLTFLAWDFFSLKKQTKKKPTEDAGNLNWDWVLVNICGTSFKRPTGGSILWRLPFLCLLGLKMPINHSGKVSVRILLDFIAV